jgi:hypothetical protein
MVGTVVVAAGAAAAAAGFGGGGSDQQTSSNLPPARAQVTRQTIQDTDEISGDLGYGAVTMLPGRLAGVVTNVLLAGDVITRGKPINRVDNTPVVLMYGGLPAYRTLSAGSEGPTLGSLKTTCRLSGTPGSRWTSGTRRRPRGRVLDRLI